MSPGDSASLGIDDVAQALEALRAGALKSMRQWRVWQGVDDAQLEDYFQDVAAVLLTRPLYSAEHVRRSLYQELGFRSKRHWQLRRRRPEIPTDDDRVFDSPDQSADDEGPTYQDVEDCLAELTERQAVIFKLHRGEGQKRKAVARQLGITEAEVLKDLYAATHRIAQFTVVLEAGRACGKRAAAIEAYVAGRATPDEVRRAKAHLAACQPCLLAYRRAVPRVANKVAALIPMPLLVSGDLPARVLAFLHGRPTGGRLDGLRDAALSVFVRQPTNAEALTAGAGGAGLAVGAKLATGACIAVVAAGGTAVCSTLGVLPGELHLGHHRHPTVTQRADIVREAGADARATLRPSGLLGAMPSPPAQVGAPHRLTPRAASRARHVRVEQRSAPEPVATPSEAPAPARTDFSTPSFENGQTGRAPTASPPAVAAAPPPEPQPARPSLGSGDFTETFENGSQ